jgi:hypothetical protein
MATSLAAWLLFILTRLEPSASWQDTYVETAFSIADAAEERPLFHGPRGAAATALLLASVAKFESDFDPGAVGDHGASLGLFQVNRVHASERELLTPGSAARVARDLMAVSMRICRARPLVERLGWYAWGRDGCDHALEKSRHRFELAQRLMRDYPPPEGP